MTLKELHKYVSAGEGSRIEFKQKLTEPAKILKEIVAFANAEGGWLFIGVSDDKKLTGIRDPEEVTTVLSKACLERVYPKIRLTPSVLPINRKKSIVAYLVSKGSKKPYYLNPENSRKGKAYFRYKDQSIQASKELVTIIKGQKKSKGYLISYTDDHRSIMHLFKNFEFLTIGMVHTELSMTEKAISVTLTSLVLAGILKVVPAENEDYYFPVDTSK